MKNRGALAVALFAAFGLGAVSTQALRAQSKPPAYFISEINVTKPDAHMKEFAPVVVKAFEDVGAKFLVRGGATVAIDGEAPKARVIVTAFDSLEQAKAFFASSPYQDARKIGDKYATFQGFVVEGIAK
jgi:uncharacterized protein (DUF1330 family)